jgi:hypothetical protein
MTPNTLPSDLIAAKALDFVRECEAHSISPKEMMTIVSVALDALRASNTEAGRGDEEEFLEAIRRVQIINKVSSTCERLRRGPQEAQDGEIKWKNLK